MGRAGVLVGAVALVVVVATPAAAGQVFFEDFDDANGGATAFNYTGFADFTVPIGTVDVVASGDYGIDCAGGAGACVDLDGSTGELGRIASKSTFTAHAGDRVTLSFDISGNQRNGDAESFFVGLSFLGVPAVLADVTPGGAFLPPGGPFPGVPIAGITYSGTRAVDAFGTYSFAFTATTETTFRFLFGAGNGRPGPPPNLFPPGDNVGPILDNVALDISAAPEPGTWALMLLGFGGLGAALRLRRWGTAG